MLKIVCKLFSEEGDIGLYTQMSLRIHKTEQHEPTNLHYTNRYPVVFLTLLLPFLLTSFFVIFLGGSFTGFIGYLFCLRARSAEWDVMFHDIFLNLDPRDAPSALDTCGGRERSMAL
jgi:hypothetical protein